MTNPSHASNGSSTDKKQVARENWLSKRIIIALVLISISLPFLWIGSRVYQIQRMVSQLRADGKPVTLLEIERPQVADERNAAFFLADCNGSLQQLLSRFFEKTEGSPWQEFPGESANQFEELELQYPALFPTLDKASECEVWRDPGERTFVDWSDPKREVSQLKSAATVIDWKIRSLVERDQSEQAVQWATRLFKLMNLYSDAPRTNMGHLNLNAMRQIGAAAAVAVLESGLPVSPEELDQLLDEVRQQDSSTHYEKALEIERAFGLDLLRQNNSVYYLSGIVYLSQMNRELESVKKGTPRGPVSPPFLPFDRRVDAGPGLSMVRLSEDRARASLQGVIELLEEASSKRTTTK